LYKIERIRGYSPAFTDTAINSFARDLRLSAPSRRLRVYEITVLSDAVLTLAETLLENYRSGKPFALRSLDAIQLASAKVARAALSSTEHADFAFVTADRQLRGVAGVEGLQTTDPEHP
jgi:predicted nucleic acid-binding protein